MLSVPNVGVKQLERRCKMISEKQLVEWERLANEATDGPWVYGENNCDVYDVYSEHDPEDVDAVCSDMLFPNSKNDAAFIAAAREAVPRLIAEVRRLQDRCDTLEDMLRDEMG